MMQTLTQESVLKALKKSARFDELIHKLNSFLDFGESGVFDDFSKEYPNKRFFSIGSNHNILTLATNPKTTSLVDKEVDLIFCNPPMDKYEEYCKRIFEESLAGYALLVLPIEWKSNAEIKAYAKANRFEIEVIGAVGYIKDNQRAKAELVLFYRFSSEAILKKKLGKDYDLEVLFQELECYRSSLIHELEDEKKEEIANETQGMDQESFFEYLLKRYKKEHQDFFKNFKSLSHLSSHFLSAIKVEGEDIVEATKRFERKHKKFYWSECLSRMPTFNLLLTQKQQGELLGEFAHRGVDFSRENIPSVLAFSLKYCKERERENFCNFWERLANEDNLADFSNLISNPKPYTHYPNEKLFYKGRLKEKVICTYAGRYDDYYPNHLRDVGIAYLIEILLQSMGYQDLSYRYSDKSVITPQDRVNLPLGISFLFAGEKQVVKFTAYKNRKLHIHFNQTTIALINLRVFIYLGWITNIKEAKESFDTLKSELLTQELQTLLVS